MRRHLLEALLNRYVKVGFDQFKVKISGDLANDREKVRLLQARSLMPDKVRADANNLWTSARQAVDYFRALNYAFWAIEEPLQVRDYEGMHNIAKQLGTKIILDESFQRVAQLDALLGPPQQWILNLRLSKLGGLLRSLATMDQARARGFSVIAGAHVGETSLLTRVALTLAAQAQDILLAQEGAVGTHLLASDVIEQSLMFGAHGVLKVADFDFVPGPGWGLNVTFPRSDLSELL